MTPGSAARLRAWRGWRDAAGPFARFVQPAPFVDLGLRDESARATPVASATVTPAPALRASSRAASIARALRRVASTTAVVLDLPLELGLATGLIGLADRGRDVPPPWVVLVVPRLDLPATGLPVDAIIATAPAPVASPADPAWWRERDDIGPPRPTWFILDGDRDRPHPAARRRRILDAHHALDADQMPGMDVLRRAGIEAVAIVGRKAVPAPDLSAFVDDCLAADLPVSFRAA